MGRMETGVLGYEERMNKQEQSQVVGWMGTTRKDMQQMMAAAARVGEADNERLETWSERWAGGNVERRRRSDQ